MVGHIAMAESSAVGHAFVAVVQGVGNGVEEIGVELARVVWDCTQRDDGFGWVIQVVGNPPNSPDVLRVGVVLV
jgi:hypothetical protein